MKYLVLFNKIFNRRKAIRKKAQIITTMLARNYYHLNTTFKDYKIKDMILKNNSKMERYLVAYKTQNLDFIILPGYIASELTTTTIMVLLKDGNNKNAQATSLKQLHKRTSLQFV